MKKIAKFFVKLLLWIIILGGISAGAFFGIKKFTQVKTEKLHATVSKTISQCAGKSTFIDALGTYLCKDSHKLAVLAIDPSSEKTKGAILGDKTRMEELSLEKNAFIRPSPSAGSLGGVARKTRESIVLCEAAGFDTIFVETVGVGQSETAMHSMVDFFLLIQLAGTGDELQGIKRGIMEMADGIAINKCDGNNIEKAQLAQRQFQNALHLFPMPESGQTPSVVTCSAYEKFHIEEVWKMCKRQSIY